MKLFYRCTLLVLILAQASMAGTTGKIAGRVVDSKSGEPLIGVNIILAGTSLGGASDFDGNYYVNNIPPGTYVLKASAVGYNSVTYDQVKVNLDFTTRIDVKLSEAVIDIGKEVVIIAERPMVQRDQTAKTAVVGGDDIQALPVTEVGQVLALQAGYVAGSLRGGRSGEVAYWIDGVPVTDAYNGGQVVELNKSIVQELQLVSGAFNAEYGQAMSGIVNIATKEGGQKFTGGMGIYGGDYLPNTDKLYPGLSFNPIHIRNIEANVSGPVLDDNLTFFTNARYIYFDGDLKGFNRFNPNNVAGVTDSTNVFRLYRDASGRGDSSVVSMNNSERYYGQAKLTWRISPLLKLTGNFIYDDTKSKPYNRDFFYNPNGTGNDYNTSSTFIFQLSHTISQSTFYTLGGSFFDKNFKHYLYENPYDPRYVHSSLLSAYDSYSFKTGGTDLSRADRSTITGILKLDVSSQIDGMNLVKAGAELRRHDIRNEYLTLREITSQSSFDPKLSNPYITTEIPATSSVYHDYYRHKPVELSFYLQDKMEFKNIIVNIGIRYDYFDPDANILADYRDPNIFAPVKPGNIFFDNNNDGIRDTVSERLKTVDDRRAYWYKKASTKSKISPRLGISFPVTDRGIVHFSYGHFFQIPRFERLYSNPDFKVGSGVSSIVGNADLEPEETVNAEIGMQQQVTDDISCDVTAYLRDVRGLTGTRGQLITTYNAFTYARYTNTDFGLIKGIILTVEKRFSDGLNVKADYTFQIARGSGSDPNAAANAVQGGSLPEVQLIPLDWDQRHTLNVTVAYTGSGWGTSAIGQYGSGLPYTPRKSSDISTLLTNSQIKPTYFNIDLQAYYQIMVSGTRIVLFARAFNVLDIRNEVGVFDDTGRAGTTADESYAISHNLSRQYVNTISEWYRIPTNYSEPRRIEFGMNLEF